jgi:hypothetical protein
MALVMNGAEDYPENPAAGGFGRSDLARPNKIVNSRWCGCDQP